MDWKSIAFDWTRARAFLITAEEGSFSAAARALNMAQPPLARQVSALEDELGVTLFERVGTGLELTDAGASLIDHARKMAEAANAFSLVASGQSDTIEGKVTITASEIYSSWLLPPLCRDIREQAPGIRVEVLASNAISDLKRREADIAIRNARPDQPDLIGKLVAQDNGGLFAAPEYLQDHGPFETPADLSRADFIGFGHNSGMVEAMQERGVPITDDHFTFSSSSHAAHWEMTRAGLGIGVGPAGLGDRDPQVSRILPDLDFTYPVWLVAHRELKTSPRLRVVWDLLAERIPKYL
jgi:DNA-binding transcriptional LysR family regulator